MTFPFQWMFERRAMAAAGEDDTPFLTGFRPSEDRYARLSGDLSGKTNSIAAIYSSPSKKRASWHLGFGYILISIVYLLIATGKFALIENSFLSTVIFASHWTLALALAASKLIH